MSEQMEDDFQPGFGESTVGEALLALTGLFPSIQIYFPPNSKTDSLRHRGKLHFVPSVVL